MRIKKYVRPKLFSKKKKLVDHKCNNSVFYYDYLVILQTLLRNRDVKTEFLMENTYRMQQSV